MVVELGRAIQHLDADGCAIFAGSWLCDARRSRSGPGGWVEPRVGGAGRAELRL